MSAWTDEEIDYNRHLHIITLCVVFPIAIATYPLQVLTSYRLLTGKHTAPIFKLIVIMAILGILQWLVHLLTRQLPAFYEFSFIFQYLKENEIEWIALYLMVFAYTFRIHFAFLISLNRFLTFRPGKTRWLHNKRIFNISLVSLLIPLALGAALSIFGNYHYVEYPMGDGRVVFRPETRNILSAAPPILYFLSLAICSYLLNGYLIHRLIVLSKRAKISTFHSTKYNTSERGMLRTLLENHQQIADFSLTSLIMVVYKSKLAAAINIISLTLNSAAPFWVLVYTVPTVRKTLSTIGCRSMVLPTNSSVAHYTTASSSIYKHISKF